MPDNISYIVWLNKSKSYGIPQEGGYFERWVSERKIASTSSPIQAKKYQSIKSAMSSGGAIVRPHHCPLEEFFNESKESVEFVRDFTIDIILNNLDLKLDGCRIDTIDSEGNVIINGGLEAVWSYVSDCIKENREKRDMEKRKCESLIKIGDN